MEFTAPRQVDFEGLSHGRGTGHQPFLVKLRFPERQRAFVEIYVANPELGGLADSQAAGVDQEDHGLYGPAHKLFGVSTFHLPSLLEDLLELFEAVDVGLPVFGLEIADSKSWIFPSEAESFEVVKKTSGELQFVVFRSCGLLGDDIDPRIDKALVDLTHRVETSEDEVIVEVSGGSGVPKAGEPQFPSEFQVGFELRSQEAVEAIFRMPHHAGLPS